MHSVEKTSLLDSLKKKKKKKKKKQTPKQQKTLNPLLHILLLTDYI